MSVSADTKDGLLLGLLLTTMSAQAANVALALIGGLVGGFVALRRRPVMNRRDGLGYLLLCLGVSLVGSGAVVQVVAHYVPDVPVSDSIPLTAAILAAYFDRLLPLGDRLIGNAKKRLP